MIQTHIHHQQTRTPEIKTGLFRKEEVLCKGVVPLVEYTTSTFVLRTIRTPPLPPHFSVVQIFNEHQHILSDFLYGLVHPEDLGQSLFATCIFPEIGAIITLIKQKIWFVYALKRQDQIYALYFLKDANLIYEDLDQVNEKKGGHLLECMGCVSNMSAGSNGLFFSGFLHAMKDILKYGHVTVGKKTNTTSQHTIAKKEEPYSMIAFTDMGHNSAILEKWRWKYTPVFETPSAYYAYNMIVKGMPIAKHSIFALL